MQTAPVVKPLPWREPREWFNDIAPRAHAAWLDTATPADAAHRYSIIAAEPNCILRAKSKRVEIQTGNHTDHHHADPFDILDQLLRQRSLANAHPFPTGAAIGYFGYDLKNLIEKLPSNADDDLHLPDCWFGFYDNLLVFDHLDQKVYEITGSHNSCRAVPSSISHFQSPTPNHLHSNFTRDEYGAAIRHAKDYIAAGDIYQVNLSQRFQCGINAAPLELYHALRTANPAPYCTYLNIGDAQILSSSPECFLRMNDRNITTRPIKGTLPRHRDPADLLRSAKDNAELLMITDLERNDLGRVCEFGSVHVPELFRVESYATVHHLVATVAGKLRPDVSHVQALRACFPGGSITGAPKIRAMEIIDELEPHARGVYCGAIGFFGYNGVSHFNIAIRTAVYQPVSEICGSGFQPRRREPVADTIRSHTSSTGLLTFHAGGGIVADSEPSAEYDETLAKAEGILRALDQLRLRQR